MLSTPLKLITLSAAILGFGGLGLQGAWGQRTWKITIPMRSRLTPVQRLNREGVEAVRKNDYRKASQLFYKAYLDDPADPFTLNNLGYISELQGQLDRANKFYKLASEQGSGADIDMSNIPELKGKPMRNAFEDLQQTPMQVNRMNVDAMTLLSQNRGFEAVELLQHALSLEPQNAFTLNNLGVADETIGDYSGALQYYNQAAASNSPATVVVTENNNWSGKPVSKMAAANARRLQDWLRNVNQKAAEAALYNRRGVFEANANNWTAAKQDFLRAYSLDPSSAFSLNNRGFVAEMEGDLESAQYFYDKAQQAGDADGRVGLATGQLARGEKLSNLAANSTYKVNGALATFGRERRIQNVPIELTPRNGAVQAPPAAKSPNQPNQSPSQSQPNNSGRTH